MKHDGISEIKSITEKISEESGLTVTHCYYIEASRNFINVT